MIKLSRNLNLAQHSILAVFILLVSALAGQAQSGRRSSGATTSPSVSGPKSVEKKAEKAPPLQLLVGIGDPNAFLNVSLYISDTVLDNCLRRLNDANDVNATSAGRGITRAEASHKAKEEKDRYVVWLQVGSELADSGKQSKNGPDELYVTYTIFEPVTGKTRQTGRAHHSIYKTGQVGVSGPRKNSPVYSEYALKQAAQETAERILDAFEIKLRDDRWPEQ